jgi:predicted Holliday junction resolvase-like endonuclease
MEIALIVVVFVLLCIILALVMRPRKVEVPAIDELEAKLRYTLASADSVKEIHSLLEDMPHDVLTSITRSQGARSGKLNELLATLELTKYDRLFYLGDPIDFVGIKYDEGIDFIEVKTGRAHFTEDELKLKDLIECKMVNYLPLSVKRINFAEEVNREEMEE